MASENTRPPFISTDTRQAKYLFLDLQPPAQARLALVCAGREVCTPDYRIDRSGFEYHAVEFVVGGTWTLRHGDVTETLRPGAVFAYGPGTAYSIEAGQGSDLVKYFVTFTGVMAEQLVADSGLSDCKVLYAQQPRWIHDLFDQLIECNSLELDAAREIGTRLNELILLRIRSDAWTGMDRQSEALRSYARCRAFIHDHYLEVATVSDIAKRCNLDPAYLARLFKRFASERPLQLLTRLKTQHAADLIMRRGYSVAAAGQAVGFADPYHFSRVFKRVHGLAPGRIPTR